MRRIISVPRVRWGLGCAPRLLSTAAESKKGPLKIIFVLGTLLKLIRRAYIDLALISNSGGPGAGKGTQCDLLVREHQWVDHISAGELLRQEQAANPPTDWSVQITKSLQKGEIVPVHITLSLLRRACIASNKAVVLIDGFPRNWDNVTGWNEAISPDEAVVEAVVCIDAPGSVLQDRILRRAATSRRDDDNEEFFKIRFERYKSDTLDIVRHFEKMGKLVHIDGSKTVINVYSDFRDAILQMNLQA